MPRSLGDPESSCTSNPSIKQREKDSSMVYANDAWAQIDVTNITYKVLPRSNIVFLVKDVMVRFKGTGRYVIPGKSVLS